MLPDASIYSKHQNVDEWMDSYAALHNKIRDSNKIQTKEKVEKINALKTSNHLILVRLTMEQNIQLARKLQPKEMK